MNTETQTAEPKPITAASTMDDVLAQHATAFAEAEKARAEAQAQKTAARRNARAFCRLSGLPIPQWAAVGPVPTEVEE